MTTTSSYCTDVICDIMLNGKEKEETLQKIRRLEQNVFLPLQAPSIPFYGVRSQRITMLCLSESQAAATMFSPKRRQH